jgi:hypothetical protein
MKQGYNLAQIPNMVCHSGFHSRGAAQGLVYAAEVVVHEVQRNVVLQILYFFGEPVGQSGKASHVHPTGQAGDLSLANQDADGTGQNNLFKYVTGLDPTNLASLFVLQIQNVPGQPNQKQLIFGPLADGRTYIVESTAYHGKDSYAALGSFCGPQTNGQQMIVTDLNATGTQMFYRVHITYP